MPGRSGTELARTLTEAAADLRVLFLCGYVDSEITERGPLSSGPELLPKPFTPEALAGRVRQVLDAPIPESGAAPGEGR
jgi:DNA-binding response OmpR family regulator